MGNGAESAGSDRAELKKLLACARKQPVHMAFALGADGRAILKLDKLRDPRALEKSLRAEDGSKGHRFGKVLIDPDSPKRVQF